VIRDGAIFWPAELPWADRALLAALRRGR